MESKTTASDKPRLVSNGRPTLRSLAEALDLSVTTVSRALKDGPEVRPDTIARVKRAAAQVGYQPDARAVTLRTGATFTLCAALMSWDAEDVGDASAIALMQGMQNGLEDTPYDLMSLSLRPEAEGLAAIQRVVSRQLADGIVIDHTRSEDRRVLYLLDRDFPFVTLGRTSIAEYHPFIDIDSEEGARRATAHLIDKGHERIVLINPGPEFVYAGYRERGYWAALAQAGLSQARIINCAGLAAEDVRRAVRALLCEKEAPSAFVTDNTTTTFGCLAAFADLGLQHGEDVDLVGNDGSRLSSFIPGAIPYIHFPHAQLGRLLIEFLQRRIEGEPVSRLQKVLSTELVLPR